MQFRQVIHQTSMERLTQKDLRRVIEALGELYAHTDLATLPELLVKLQSRLVPCDISTYNDFNGTTGQMCAVHDYPGADAERLFPQFVANMHEYPIHPGLPAAQGCGAVKISDFMGQRKFEGLGLYHEFYRHFGIRFQMAFFIESAGQSWVGNGLQRIGSDFSERDRRVLSLIGPHFAVALKTARSVTALRSKLEAVCRGLDWDRRGTIRLGADDKIQWLTGNCSEWLRVYFDAARSDHSRLPVELERLVHRRDNRSDAEQIIACPRKPLVVEGAGRRLTVRRSEEPDGGVLLLLDEQRDVESVSLQGFGLTAREREVATWIVQGKTNPEIGLILGISPRTVDKHEERILRKLSVENRAGIMLKVLSATV